MTDLEYVLVTSIGPVGALIMAAILFLLLRPKPKDRAQPPGE